MRNTKFYTEITRCTEFLMNWRVWKRTDGYDRWMRNTSFYTKIVRVIAFFIAWRVWKNTNGLNDGSFYTFNETNLERIIHPQKIKNFFQKKIRKSQIKELSWQQKQNDFFKKVFHQN